jgi:glycosyltransferase involved in cell wall biosynthesis
MTERVLVLTTLDYTVEKNQRCQHVARTLARRYGGAVVISKHRNVSVRLSERLRKLVPSVRIRRTDAVRVYDLNPLLNQSFAAPFRLLGFVSELLVVPSMLILFAASVRKRFPLCYAEGPWEMAAALLIRFMGGVGTIVYGDIDYIPAFQKRPFRRQLTAALERFVMRRADLVISTGSLLAERRRREIGIEPVVIHNGVNYRAFSAGAGKEEHPPTIIYFGNLEERYSGISVALEGMPLIREQVTGAVLTIIGNDPDGTVDGMIESLGLGGAVTRLDSVPYIELPLHLRRADVGFAVFPDNELRTYAFPMKVIEYMAGGLAVVGTAGTETQLILDRFESGVVVPFDAGEYARAVIDLFRDRRKLAEMADNGVRSAERFDWDGLMAEVVRHVERLYPGEAA